MFTFQGESKLPVDFNVSKLQIPRTFRSIWSEHSVTYTIPTLNYGNKEDLLAFPINVFYIYPFVGRTLKENS